MQRLNNTKRNNNNNNTKKKDMHLQKSRCLVLHVGRGWSEDGWWLVWHCMRLVWQNLQEVSVSFMIHHSKGSAGNLTTTQAQCRPLRSTLPHCRLAPAVWHHLGTADKPTANHCCTASAVDTPCGHWIQTCFVTVSKTRAHSQLPLMLLWETQSVK